MPHINEGPHPSHLEREGIGADAIRHSWASSSQPELGDSLLHTDQPLVLGQVLLVATGLSISQEDPNYDPPFRTIQHLGFSGIPHLRVDLHRFELLVSRQYFAALENPSRRTYPTGAQLQYHKAHLLDAGLRGTEFRKENGLLAPISDHQGREEGSSYVTFRDVRTTDEGLARRYSAPLIWADQKGPTQLYKYSKTWLVSALGTPSAWTPPTKTKSNAEWCLYDKLTKPEPLFQNIDVFGYNIAHQFL